MFLTISNLEQLKALLERESSLPSSCFSYEIQDDYRFLLVSVALGNYEEMREAVNIKGICALLDGRIPKRIGENSWMLNFVKDGKVIDSYFGGDMDFPSSGLPE